LHGYGADAADLASLATQMDLSGPLRWLFPDAPFPLSNFSRGRAWFPIDQEQMLRVQMGLGALEVARTRHSGFDEAVRALQDFLAAVEAPWEKLIVGGFSQGAMLALELALRAPAPPLGLFILSGTLLDEAALRQAAPSRKDLKFFQSHGSQDSLLDFEGGRRLHDLLLEAGLDGELVIFNGGHAVPGEVSRALERYLEGLLEGLSPRDPKA